MTFTYVCTYFIVDVISMAIGLVIFRRLKNDMGSEKQINTLRWCLISFIFFCFTNSLWIWINNGYLKLNGTINSMANLISICAGSYFWFSYIQLRTNPAKNEDWRFMVLILLPLVITVLTIITSPFTKLVFYYENGKYIHGQLYEIMVLLAMFYLFIATIQLIYYNRRIVSKTLKKETRTLMQFLLYPLCGGIVDIIIPNLPIMELTIIAGIVAIFTNLQSSRIFNDSLTGVANRNRVEEYYSEQMEHYSKDNPLYVIIADVDGLKNINDEFGHYEGNQALRMISNSLKHIINERDGLVARWGGDEFLIITTKHRVGNIDDFIHEILVENMEKEKTHNLPYYLQLSIGYSEVLMEDKSIEEAVARADRMMYTFKEEHRKKAREKRAGIFV